MNISLISGTELLKSLEFPVSSVQLFTYIQLFVTPWIAAHEASLSITNSWSLLKLMSIEPVMPSNHLILCRPLLLPSIFPTIRVFSNESVLHIRWPKYWSSSFSISPSNEYSGLISFTIDWLDLLAVQGTLKSLLQHHSSKASILQRSAFFIVQLSHSYMAPGKAIALTRWTFVGKVMSLLFNMLSKMVIAFLPSSKHLLISWLQSPSAVTLEPPKIKSFMVSPSICYEVMRKGRRTKDQIANIRWIIEEAREFQKNIYFCFIDYATVRTGHGTTYWFQRGKGVRQVCILSPCLNLHAEYIMRNAGQDEA